MKPLAVLIGIFLLIDGALGAVWLSRPGTPAPGAAHGDSASPAASPGASVAARPTQVSTPSVPSQPTSPAQTPTAAAATPLPVPSPGKTTTHVLTGSAFSSSQIPDGASVGPSGDGVLLQAAPKGTDPLSVTYVLDAAELAPGATVQSVTVLVCGAASGSTYELDGPPGTSQTVRKSVPPEADGCWHLESVAPTELSVTASVGLGSLMAIKTVEYTVTTDR